MELECICGNTDLTQIQDMNILDDGVQVESFECPKCDRLIHITYYEGAE